MGSAMRGGRKGTMKDQWMKRAGIGVLAAVLLAGSALLGGCGQRADAGEAVITDMEPEALRQVVASDNQHGRTIMWQQAEEETASVEYRTEGSGTIRSVQAGSRLLKGNRGEPDRYIYEARLDGLEPGDSYEYRTRAGNHVSPWHRLTADDGGAFTALIFPDTQSQDYGVWRAVAEAGRKQAPEAEFFINMGDLVDCGQDEYQWQAWLQGAGNLFRTMPVAPVMGNHEAYSLDWKMTLPERYLAHFTLPDNGNPSLAGLFYSFDWGPVHFTVLNTQAEELREWYPDLFEKELAWLEQDLSGTKQPWKVVLMHRDSLQYRIASRPERKEGISPEGEIFMPVFDRMRVDAVLSAHLHTYRNRGHIYDFQRDARGPLYILTGVAGDVRYPNLWTNHALDVTVAPQPETDNFLTMEADADRLCFRAWLPDGTQIDEAVLTK